VTGQRSNQLNYVPRVKRVTLKRCDSAIRLNDPMVGRHGFEPRTFPLQARTTQL